MASTLTQLLIDIDQLPPSKRKSKLVAFALSHFKGEQTAPRQELNAKVDAFQIVPGDYALLLHTSNSLSWALDVLKTSPHPAIVTTAVDIVGKAWRKNPLRVKGVFGGEGSKELVELIDISLPRYATLRLFRLMGTVPRVSSAHSSTVDDILKAVFPFLTNKDVPTPLTRYARSSIIVLFTAASPSVLNDIVQRCAAWFNEGTWERLTDSRPDLMEEILLRQVHHSQESPHTSKGDLVVKKEWNKVIMWALLRRQKDSAFFIRFLERYVSQILEDKEAPDVFGAYRLNRAITLFELMGFILRKRTDSGQMLQTAIAFCDTLTSLVDAGACGEWDWESARPLLEIACHEFGKFADEWSLTKIETPTTLVYPPTATGLLLAIFKKQTYPAGTFSSPNATLVSLLRRLPLPARLPFLDLLYKTKTSESLIETPKNRTTYPSFSAFLLSLLYPPHGRALLEVGKKAREGLFLSSQTYSSRTKLYDFSGLSTADATSPVLFANWTSMEQSVLGDRTAQLGQAGDATVRDVEAYKKRAMRSRDDRSNLVTTTLVLSLLSRSPSLFVDTLSWAVKRYAKDPVTGPLILGWMTDKYGSSQYIIDFLSGPVGLYASHRTHGKLTKDILIAWCTNTNKTFDLLLDLLRVWVSEPSYGSSIQQKHAMVGSLLFDVVERRSALIDKAFPVLLDDLVGLGDALLFPLVEHWIKWEKFKVQEHPDVLGFNAIHCSPCKSYQTLTVHARILPAVFPFIDKVGYEREQLYEVERRKLSIENMVVESRRSQQLGGSRHMLPFDLTITGAGSKTVYCRGAHLPKQLNAYVKSIVVPDPEKLSATLNDQDDKLDWHPDQFSEALESYLVYSMDKNEIDGKILQLWQLYGPSTTRADLRAVILRSDMVQSWLWDREALNGQVRPWLPDFPAADRYQDVDFDPLPLMPPRIDIDDEGMNLMLALREPEEDEECMLKSFLAPFKQYGSSIGGASINTTHRLAVLVVAWILTMLKVPRIVLTEAGDGPVDYAVQKVRLSQEFMDIYNNSVAGGYTDLARSLLPCRMLYLVLPLVSLREVDSFVRAVFSVAKTPTSEAVSMAILGAVRRLGIPHLASEQAFHVLEDVEASSWHRQTITTGTVNLCRPPAARDLADRLLTYTQERHRQQIERRQTLVKRSIETTASSNGLGPLLKMSTHKMVMQLLQTVVQQGSIDASFIERSATAGLLEVPAAIRSYVVDILAGIAQDSFVISREGDEQVGKWEVLSPFIAAAQRLSEDVSFSDEQWTAARTGEIPLPDIAEERYIAASLLSRDTFSMPSSLKRAWAEKVVEPIIEGHVKTRTMWMRTAVAREGGSPDLEASIKATYGSGIPATSSFTTFAPHLSESHKSLLEILEHDALRFLNRSSCQELRDLMDKNHPEGWERESYGKYVTQLTAYAISDATESGSQAMTAIAGILSKPNMPFFLIGDVTASLKRIGLTLLQPDYMSIHANLKAVIPFASFTRFVTAHLAPPSKDSLDPKIVSLLAEYLSLAEALEHQKSEESLNGGACYWRVNLILKLLSLRNATNMPMGDASDWIETRARQLAELAKYIADGGWYHVHFPHSFESYLRLPRVEDVTPVCLALTRAPNCPAETGWHRALCFDTAAMLLRAKQNDIVASPAALRQLAGLKEVWENDADGSIGCLSLSWHHKGV